jgi:hypothetical protein
VAAATVLWALTLPTQAHGIDVTQDAAESMQRAREDLSMGRLDRAEIGLERVLMLQPDHAEARIEMALLMARKGQAEVARSLLRGLAEDPRTPEDFRTRLRSLSSSLSRLEAGLNASAKPVAPSRVPEGALVGGSRATLRVEASVTWSSNPLARTAEADLTFTTPEGTLAVPLADKAEPGMVTNLGLVHQGKQATWELNLSKTNVAASGTAFRLAAWGKVPGTWKPLASVQWNFQALEGFDGARRYTAGLAWNEATRRWSAQAYVDPSIDDSGLLARLDLQIAQNKTWQSSAFIERSESLRRLLGSWRTGAWFRLQPRADWELSFLLQDQKDLHGYSPLLASGAPRRLTLAHLGIEKTHRVGIDKAIAVRLLASERRSNIELFSYREAAVQVTLIQMLQ